MPRRSSEPPSEVDAFTIDEFCARHRISRNLYYKLRSQGRAPAELHLGSRVVITRKAVDDWHLKYQSEPPPIEPAA
jgi:predicted DNA-binding transcriptional regulator AlpA